MVIGLFHGLFLLPALLSLIGPTSSAVDDVQSEASDQSFKKSEEGKDLSDELADVLFVLTCLANQTGVDLEEAFRKNMDKKTNRDKDRHKNNQKLSK